MRRPKEEAHATPAATATRHSNMSTLDLNLLMLTGTAGGAETLLWRQRATTGTRWRVSRRRSVATYMVPACRLKP